MKRSKHSAFTLVELLVVISIVGTLVALLLPAISQAKESARRITCTANQRSMGVAMLNFEQEYQRLPNLKFAQGTLMTLEGQPWSDNSPGVNIYSNYTGNQEYRVLLVDFMGAKILPLQGGKHLYIPNWSGSHSLDCPSAVPNVNGSDFDPYFAANPANGNPYGTFYKWGALQMEIQPAGMNWLYWNGNTPNYVTNRRTFATRIPSTREVVLVNEVCRLGTTAQGANNHGNVGTNAIWFDLSGGWIPMKDTVAAGIDTWAGGNRFGDAGVTQARIPSARWAQVGGGFRIQEFGTYYGNGNMNPAYPAQVQTGLDMIAKMGYSRALNF